MVNVKLDPQEAQFIIAAIHNTQIMGSNAHLVSSTLKKIESKLENLVPVQEG